MAASHDDPPTPDDQLLAQLLERFEEAYAHNDLEALRAVIADTPERLKDEFGGAMYVYIKLHHAGRETRELIRTYYPEPTQPKET